MSSTLLLHTTSNWRELLLQAHVPPGLAEALPEFLKRTGQTFLSTVAPEISPQIHCELDAWYASSAAQEALALVTRTLWNEMASQSHNAMPAHDARHAMYKVPTTALQYMASEGVEGWQRIGLLGGLLHDYGRWAEELIFGEPRDSLVHARLSYLMGAELLKRFDLPPLITQHILLAAIRHTTGANPDDPMPLKLTVTADRDQLYGPEIILRLSHHMVNQAGDMGCYYGEKSAREPILAKLERYLTNRLPGPLFSRQGYVDHLWEILATFILLAEGADDSKKRFSTLRAKPGAAHLRHQNFDWEFEWSLAQDIRPSRRGRTPELVLKQFLNSPHVAPAPRYKEAALAKVDSVPPKKAAYLTTALAFANEQLVAQDQYQYSALRRITAENPSDLFVRTMAGLLMEDWQGAATSDKTAQKRETLSRS